MSSTGTMDANDPQNPFAKQGPAPTRPANGQVNGGQQPRGGVSRPGGSRQQNIAQLAQSIGEMELSNQEDLYAFCEAYRAILNYLAISAKLAEGQLKTAARAQAREVKDGWMNPIQRAQLALTLRNVGRDLDKLANNCADGGVNAVKAWRRFEGFLDDLETGGSGGSRRPGGGRPSGFSVVR